MTDMRPEEDSRIGFTPRSDRPELSPPVVVRRWRLAPILALAVAAVFAIAIWVAYTDDSIQDEMEPPVGEVVEGPVKVLPEDPGGMQIPNQDKQIFGWVEGQPAPGGESEQLLPPPESPLPVAAPQDPVSTEPTQPTSTAGAEAVAPATQQAAVTPPTAVQPAATSQPAALGSQIRIQLASFSKATAALKAWPGLVEKHQSQLDGLTPYVETAEIAGRGTFHRLQAGPFADQASAKAVCAKLTAAGQGCLVVGN
jgi:cell division septation protein DedD